MHAIAINWATMTFPLSILNLQIMFIDMHISRLGPVDLVLFTLPSEPVNI